ncbi:hypothetical protein QEG98_36945 [Myxococcus sp. MxC21-1]|uniref:hypothetical protein n=1 Tax=Myxococcus sp. MxC21-1 TaxID=3041439 RepID=UPI00292E9DFB|nr:hypothetical protein [Myxococcus sp. MxC21-1]WNZ61405.1 hypothetical protein QEG98_36945 [Myxococcus sp. MxC21-1]
MLTVLGNRARAWVAGPSPWSNTYGLARTLVALGTGGTLAFSDTTTLFRPVAGIPEAPVCEGIRAASFFCVLLRLAGGGAVGGGAVAARRRLRLAPARHGTGALVGGRQHAVVRVADGRR